MAMFNLHDTIKLTRNQKRITGKLVEIEVTEHLGLRGMDRIYLEFNGGDSNIDSKFRRRPYLVDEFDEYWQGNLQIIKYKGGYALSKK